MIFDVSSDFKQTGQKAEKNYGSELQDTGPKYQSVLIMSAKFPYFNLSPFYVAQERNRALGVVNDSLANLSTEHDVAEALFCVLER